MCTERENEASVGEQGIDKATAQERLYVFPYHYIPHVDQEGLPKRFRVLSWGLEYLCYVLHAREIVDSLAPSSVLDVGCGDGRFLGLIKDVTPRCVGVDVSEQAIAFARAFHRDVEFVVGDVNQLSEFFDLVCAIEVLEHIPEPEAASFTRAVLERARPGGHVLISVPTTAKPLIHKHYRHYDLQTLNGQLAASGIEHEIVRTDYLYRASRLVRLYRRITSNRLWFCEPHIVRRWIWWYIWNRTRIAREGEGEHLLVLLRKGTHGSPS